MEDFLNQALQAVIIAAIPVIVPPLAVYLVAQARSFMASLSDSQQYAVRSVVGIFVAAAEQMYTPDEWAEKKAYVMRHAQEYFDAHKIKISVALIEAELEAAVRNLPKSHDTPEV